jgi:hypothetical protein
LGDFKPVGVKKEGAVLTNRKHEIDDNGINLQFINIVVAFPVRGDKILFLIKCKAF